jgi:enoyl-CoA hydratase/carnithine racemase
VALVACYVPARRAPRDESRSAGRATVSVEEFAIADLRLPNEGAFWYQGIGNRQSTIGNSARNYTPREALEMGVLDELQPADRLLTRAMEVAREMASLPRSTYVRIKRSLRSQALALIDDAISNRNEPMLESWLSDETRIASAEALKKR